MIKLYKESAGIGSEKSYYHATFGYYLNSIKEHGLGANIVKQTWDISEKGYTYFVNDLEVAASFCECADEDVPDEIYNSGIVVLEVKERLLTPYTLDNNIKGSHDEDTTSEGDPIKFIKTKNIIPFSKMKVHYYD